jgi:hypothetical protein
MGIPVADGVIGAVKAGQQDGGLPIFVDSIFEVLITQNNEIVISKQTILLETAGCAGIRNPAGIPVSPDPACTLTLRGARSAVSAGHRRTGHSPPRMEWVSHQGNV